MKKRIGTMLLMLWLLSLLSGTALASPLYDSVYISVSSWADLQEAMDTIEKDEANTYDQPYYGILIKTDNFVWPAEGGELVIDYYDNQTTDYSNTPNQKHRLDLYLSGSTWEIPENVTLTSYEYLKFDPFVDYSMNSALTVTVNGELVFKDRGNMTHSGYSGMDTTFDLVVNGNLTSSDTYETKLSGVHVVLNGSLTCPHRFNCGDLTYNKSATLNLGDIYNYITVSGELTLEDGAKVDKDIRLLGDRITAEGSAEVGYIQLSYDTTFVGDLTTGAVQLGDHSLTIPAGSNVSIERFSYTEDGGTVNVSGTLILQDNYSNFENSTLNIAEGGVVKMQSGAQFGSADVNSTITGDGVLELYGILRKNTYTYNGEEYTNFHCETAPRIFGVDSDSGNYVNDVFVYDELTGIAETVTVKRMWDNCAHSCGEGAVLAPTCGSYGYTYDCCGGCGSEIRWDYTQATEKHTPTYEKDSDNRVWAECSVCGSRGRITITAENGQYNGGTAVQTAQFEMGGSLSWWVDFTLPEITYTNNTEIGTATASATFGSITISTTFEIVGCDHEGGTATCSALAVCTKCGEPYGELASHTPGTAATCNNKAVCSVCGQEYGNVGSHVYTVVHDATSHWVECTGCGLGYLEEEYGYTSKDQADPEVWVHIILEAIEMAGTSNRDLEIWLMTMEELGTFDAVLEHSYKDGACVVCGRSEKTTAVTGTISGVKSDTTIKVMQAGQLVGEGASEDGSFSVSASGECDVVISKGGCLTWTIKGVNVDDGDIDLGEVVMVAGDVNEDGKINIADMGVFRQNFGKTAEKDCTITYA